jgi:lactoylglutathione lyase
MKLHHIGINVRSLEYSKRFYQLHFGFKEEYSTALGSEHILFLSRGEDRLELIHDPETDPPPLSNIHFAWEVRDLEGKIKQLSHQGLKTFEGPILLSNGWKAAFYKGPDGELIELISIE